MIQKKKNDVLYIMKTPLKQPRKRSCNFRIMKNFIKKRELIELDNNSGSKKFKRGYYLRSCKRQAVL